MAKLLPCPFCGKRVRVLDVTTTLDTSESPIGDPDEDYWTVVCNIHKKGCGASSGFAFGRKAAIKRWNTRFSASASTSEVKI